MRIMWSKSKSSSVPAAAPPSSKSDAAPSVPHSIKVRLFEDDDDSLSEDEDWGEEVKAKPRKDVGMGGLFGEGYVDRESERLRLERLKLKEDR